MSSLSALESLQSIEDTRAQLLAINSDCLCLPLDRAQVDRGIADQAGAAEMRRLLADRPHLFAGTGVFLSADDFIQIKAQISGLEAAIALPGFGHAVGTRMGGQVSTETMATTRGLCMGYDFHITPEGPRLIEINTNAGGVFLVSAMLAAAGESQVQCCDSASWHGTKVAEQLLAMFEAEWRHAGREGRPRSIAIVDDDPANQYLYPDMLLAKDLLVRHGIETVIVDAAELALVDGQLCAGDLVIDMIYNRSTDFALTDPAHSMLRRALVDDTCVISPAPHHHQLYADKRNLVLLGDGEKLTNWGLAEKHRSALATLPKTLLVGPHNAEMLWAKRREFFFKPAAGFGSRATYRGAKLTRRVWGEILQGNYVAQAFIAPSYRGLAAGQGTVQLKYDVRAYTYAGEVLLFAARAYQGQTTNFRTEGGGFAPVLGLSAAGIEACKSCWS